jgi:Cu-Zn family superoxide dismutase
MNVRVFPAVAALALLLVVTAQSCASAAGETATAVLKLVNGSDAGTVKLTQATTGVLLKLDLKGLTPGPHGLHVHESGKCDGDFSSAGGIYNPLGSQHGLFNEEGPMVGDLPNVVAAADGTVAAELLSPSLSLSKDAEEGLFDADGSSLVLFDKADDYISEPEGGAAGRIACGVLKAQ